VANTPVRPSTGDGSGYMCGTEREMHSSRSARLAHGKPEPRGSSPRLLAVRTGVRFFKRAAADSLGIWISPQEGPAHHSWVNLTTQVPTDPPVAAVAVPACILWRSSLLKTDEPIRNVQGRLSDSDCHQPPAFQSHSVLSRQWVEKRAKPNAKPTRKKGPRRDEAP
jgi:hypothetical protein